jgi:hypothetical protein
VARHEHVVKSGAVTRKISGLAEEDSVSHRACHLFRDSSATLLFLSQYLGSDLMGLRLLFATRFGKRTKSPRSRCRRQRAWIRTDGKAGGPPGSPSPLLGGRGGKGAD